MRHHVGELRGEGRHRRTQVWISGFVPKSRLMLHDLLHVLLNKATECFLSGLLLKETLLPLTVHLVAICFPEEQNE